MENQHWTDDVELLETYVLNRLDPTHRHELEKHLATCNHCRAAVRQEQLLVAGVRREARQDLKKRLRHRLSEEPVRTISWTRVAAVAAVVVILLGIGIYNNWFRWYEKEETADEFRPEQPAPEVPEEDLSIPPTETRGERESLRQSQPRSEELVAAGKRRSAEGAAGESGVTRSDEMKLKYGEGPTEAGKPTSAVLWTQGTVITTGIAPALTQTAGEMSRTDVKKKSFPAEGQRMIAIQQKLHSQSIILQQRMKKELPSASLRTHHTIPTLIERTDNGFRFTLYFDTTVTDEDLRHATIESVEADSLIFQIGNYRIGYRIPPNWLDSAPAKE